MSAPRDFNLVLLAGVPRELSARGKFFGVIEAPASAVTVELDSGDALRRGAGGSILTTALFSRARITSPIDQTVRVLVADEVQDVSNAGGGGVTTTGPFNTLPIGGDVTLAAGAATLVAAADPTRVGILITNLTGNPATIRLSGDAGMGATDGLPLEPGDSLTLETTAAIYAYNPGGAGQDVAVLPLQQV